MAIDPRYKLPLAIGLGVAVMAGLLVLVVILRSRSQEDVTTPSPSPEASQTEPTQAARPTGAKPGVAAPSGQPPPAQQPGYVFTKGDIKAESPVEAQLLNTVQTFSAAEKKALGLPLDQEIHYKWVVPPEGSSMSGPQRIIIDLPVQTNDEIQVPEKK
jgi:hypothetical protein